MAEVVRQGIEKANQDLEQEEQRKLAQEASDITVALILIHQFSLLDRLVSDLCEHAISGLRWFPPNSPNLG